jgi:hypothetical protein
LAPVVVENGFPEDFLDAIADEVANIDQSHIISSLDVRQIKQEASQGFGPATQLFFELVDSESFRDFISIITGVDNLISDPTHRLEHFPIRLRRIQRRRDNSDIHRVRSV